jgi:hypothetical protein
MKTKLAAPLLVALIAAGCGGSDSAEPARSAEPATVSPTASVSSSTQATPAPTAPAVVTQPVTTVVPTTGPPASTWPDPVGYQEAIYDPVEDSILVVGGCTGAYCTPVDSVWSLDASRLEFSPRSPIPFAGDIPLAYDAASDAIVALQVAFRFLDHDPVGTWLYDRGNDAWTEVGADPQPRLGVGARLAYDSESDLIVAFGGQGDRKGEWTTTDETWAYDVDTNTWIDMAPDPHPAWINYSAFVYDAESDLIVLYGLADRGGDQLWTYDVDTNTWTQLELTGGPETAPAYARGVYLPQSDQIVVYGGLDSHGQVRDDVWSYDVDTNAWAELADNPITGTYVHTFTYVDSSGLVIAFGGGPTYRDFYGNRLLAYDPVADTWEEATPPDV